MYRVPKPRRYLSPEEIGRGTAMAQGTYDGHKYTATEACRIFGLARGALINQVPAFEDTAKRRRGARGNTATATNTGRRSPPSGRRRQPAQGSDDNDSEQRSTTGRATVTQPPNASGTSGHASHEIPRERQPTVTPAIKALGQQPDGQQGSGRTNEEEGKRTLGPSPPRPRIDTLPNHDYKTGQTVEMDGRLLTVNALVGKDRLVLEDDNYNKLTVESSQVSRPRRPGRASAA